MNVKGMVPYRALGIRGRGYNENSGYMGFIGVSAALARSDVYGGRVGSAAGELCSNRQTSLSAVFVGDAASSNWPGPRRVVGFELIYMHGAVRVLPGLIFYTGSI